NLALYVRSAAGTWSPQVPVVIWGDPIATRPNLNLDPSNNRVYVFYTNTNTPGSQTIEYRTSDMDQLAFGSPTTFIAKSGGDFNDTTSTKQLFSPESGVLAIAKDQVSQTAYFNRKDIAGVDADGD